VKKTYIYITICLLVSITSYSQTNIEEIESLLSKEKVTEAKVLIENGIKTGSLNPKLYLYKALLLQNDLTVDLDNVKKFDLIKKIETCLHASLEYDEHLSLLSIIKEEYLTLQQQMMYTGMALFNEKDYLRSLELFEENIKIASYPFVNKLDTIVWFNAAVSAEKAKIYNKAEYYYSLILHHDPMQAQAYFSLAQVYKTQSKKKEFFEILQKGELLFPDQKLYFYNEYIYYYLETNAIDSCFAYIDKSLAIDSLNEKLYFLKGSIAQDYNKKEAAKEAYSKAIEINPKYVDAAFNLSAIYYNDAIDIYKRGKLKRKEKKQLKKLLNQTVENLLIVYSQEEKNINVLKLLHSCYTMLKNKSEQEKFEIKINEIKQ
jgi:tetratricopeptide (TPR) repeat protein